MAVKVKRSGTASATPSALEHGELAINYADGKIYWKNASNVIQSFSFASIDGGEVLAPPNAPTSLAASPSSGALALTWTAPAYAGSTAITGYTVEYTPSGGSASTVNANSASASYTLTGLTNGTSYTVRVRAINSVGSGAYSTSITATPAVVVSMSFSAFYSLGNVFTSSEYSTTGSGTPASPLVAVVGGNTYHDNRLWLLITQSGTLSWSLQMSSEQGYDFGALYRTTGSPAQHAHGDAIPATATTLSVRSGTQTASGTLSVTSGQYVVVKYTKDDTGDAGTDNITVTLSIT